MSRIKVFPLFLTLSLFTTYKVHTAQEEEKGVTAAASATISTTANTARPLTVKKLRGHVRSASRHIPKDEGHIPTDEDGAGILHSQALFNEKGRRTEKMH